MLIIQHVFKLYQKKEPIKFVLAGGVLRNQPTFAKTVGETIKAHWSKASVCTQKREGVWGAIEMTRNLETQLKPEIVTLKRKEPTLSPTEQRNPRSIHLDKLPLTKGVDLMLTEEARAGKAVRAEAKKSLYTDLKKFCNGLAPASKSDLT